MAEALRQSLGPRKRKGVALEPTRGRCLRRCLLDRRQRARPFEICPLVLEPEGPTVTLQDLCRPLWFQHQNEWFQGPLPLAGFQGAAPLGQGSQLRWPWRMVPGRGILFAATRRGKSMRGALIGAGVLAVSYVLIALLLYLLQRRILYQPNRHPPDLAAAAFPGVRQVTVTTSDGLALLAWYLPPARDNARVVLYLHGNAAHIGNRAYRLAPYQRLGWGVFLLEYRGYGGNPGQPSEAGLITDAHAGLAALREMGFSLSAIVVWGESLGTGPAVQLAVEHKVAAVLLESAYTSIADIARLRYRLFPVDWLLLDRFDSLRKVSSIQAPVLVMHGAYDQIVPVAMGRAVHAAAPDPKQLWIASDAGHLDLVEAGAIEVAGHFVSQLDRVTAGSV